MFSKDQEITHEAVNKKLSEIVSARGKRGTDRNTQIDLLLVRVYSVILLCIILPILQIKLPKMIKIND